MNKIPKDDRLNTLALSELLKDTQNSYKHLLFGFLLKEIKTRTNIELFFTPSEIQRGMLEIAEYPAIKCHLSLGIRDQTISNLRGEKEISHHDLDLLRWVPYRLIRPFFSKELKNKKEGIVNQTILQLAAKEFVGSNPPLYRLVVNDHRQLEHIEIHPRWRDYLLTHFEIIDGWRRWHWSNYLQRRNPSALNVILKLEKPSRSTKKLNELRKIWRNMQIADEESIRCTYSNNLIEVSGIVVDHFIPWNYLGHDQSWNLCPTIQSINSKKSDKLPRQYYLKSLALIQHNTLTWMKKTQSQKRWEIFSEDYITSLQISEDKLLNKFEFDKALERTISPHYVLAMNMGFETDWTVS
jgi:5-methylcytosine-specific restriction endonuclease McrA